MSEMTVPELRKVAKGSIKGYGRMRKDELIAELSKSSKKPKRTIVKEEAAPSIISCKILIDCARKGPTIQGMQTSILPAKTLLFRGLDLDRRSEEIVRFSPKGTDNYRFPDRPLFYASAKQAEVYGGPACYIFQLKRDVTLLDLYTVPTLRSLSKILKGEDLDILKIITGFGVKHRDEKTFPKSTHSAVYDKEEEEILTDPSGYFSEEDHEKGEYTNLRFARIICRLGFDGWITRENDVPEWEAGYPDYVGYYPGEVVLCNPKDQLVHRYDLDQKMFSCTAYR